MNNEGNQSIMGNKRKQYVFFVFTLKTRFVASVFLHRVEKWSAAVFKSINYLDQTFLLLQNVKNNSVLTIDFDFLKETKI